MTWRKDFYGQIRKNRQWISSLRTVSCIFNYILLINRVQLIHDRLVAENRSVMIFLYDFITRKENKFKITQETFKRLGERHSKAFWSKSTYDEISTEKHHKKTFFIYPIFLIHLTFSCYIFMLLYYYYYFVINWLMKKLLL